MAGGGAQYGVLARIADLIWPPRSLLSEAVVDRPGVIEPALWAQLQFLGPPQCDRCGFALPQDLGAAAVCGACAADPPVYDHARAALAYDEHARRMVLQMKRAGRRDGLPVFAAWMAHAGAGLLAQADLLVPTPLHWRRLAARKFNQAAWLAQALSRRTGRPWSTDALLRIKASRSQEGLNPAERARNVSGAFRARVQKTNGKAIVLIDDVFTTGATAQACARALKKAGAAQVDVLTLARVMKPREAGG